MRAVFALLAALPAISAVRICSEFPAGRGVFETGGEWSHFMTAPLCPTTDPDGRGAVNPTFTMYTRGNRNNGQLVSPSQVPNVFSPSRRTQFISHGWNTDSDASTWMTRMKNNLLNRGDYNVVIIDWRGGSRRSNYLLSGTTTRTIGAWVAETMLNLVQRSGASWNNMHCIGHSLGGHLCGFAGHHARDHLRVTLNRVSAMDPAGPQFERNDENTRVNRFSAQFVDVTHTDTINLGNRDLLGHQDYYPADGQQQPGCGLDVGGVCSHGRAPEYYTDSVASDCFVARYICTGRDNNVIPTGCSPGSASNMGYGSRKVVSGNNQRIYWLDVNSRSPYCQG